MVRKAALQKSIASVAPITAANTDKQSEIIRYAQWLTTEKIRCNNSILQEESRKYSEIASKTITLQGKEFRPFAPFRHEYSAYKTLTSGQVGALSIITLMAVLGLIFYGLDMVIAIIAMITIYYLSSFLLDFWLTMRAVNNSVEEQIDDTTVHMLVNADWPSYTILCPLYREVAVVPQFVKAMQALDYPADKLQILFLTEEDDEGTREAIAALALPQHFRIVTVPAGQPRTKPRACNFGLLQATGDYVVIYDAEDIPDPLQLKKAVLTFANHGSDLACVQAKLNYYNPRQNLLTRWFTVEYSFWFGLMLPAMQQLNLPLPLGGTSNHFRIEILRRVGAWDPFNVTEDCDLGLRLASSQLKTIVLDSITYEEANSQVKNWIRQRSRWIKGYLQTYLVHMRHPLRYFRRGSLREFLSLQLIIGGKTGALFVNPLMWALVIIYFMFRPVDLYHALFPAPVLYMGTLCLVFGNFFYTYIHLVGCLKLTRYNLIRWAFFIPIYWLMMSTAAFMALFQLIFKPHYWEKTKHGLHLHTAKSSNSHWILDKITRNGSSHFSPGFIRVLSKLQNSHKAVKTTVEVIEEKRPLQSAGLLLSAADLSSNGRPFAEDTEEKEMSRLTALSRSDLPPVHFPKPSISQKWFRKRLEDPWLLAVLIIACIASFSSCWYFFQHHQILLYNDAVDHVKLAHRVFDNTPPGFAQLGGVWLPLPHVLMLPFAWNDYLWRTGLAGSFSSMLCYIVATVYLFLAARRLTQDSRASFVGTLLFILNPNVLYVQATPLSEMVCVVTTVMTCYYFFAWIQDEHLKHLVWMAASCFLATLARYDGWGLLLVVLVLLVVVGKIKRQPWVKIQGTLLIFGSLGSLGIALWCLWTGLILGDPLYWHDYLINGQVANDTFYTYHNMQESIHAYMALSIATIGPIVFVLAFLAVVVFVLRFRRTPATIVGAVAFLTPFVFYILSFYTGQVTIYMPGVGPWKEAYALWNVRFGTEAVAPVGFFLSILAMRWLKTKQASLWTAIRQIFLVILIGIQAILVARGGIISLQDGQYGFSCQPARPITIYLAQHYAGGRVLEDINDYRIVESEIEAAHLKDFIYEGSGDMWKQALKDPASVVDWIIVPPGDKTDPIVKHVDLKSPKFLSQFTFVLQQKDGISLYHRTGRPPLPTRPISSNLLTDRRLCGA